MFSKISSVQSKMLLIEVALLIEASSSSVSLSEKSDSDELVKDGR